MEIETKTGTKQGGNGKRARKTTFEVDLKASVRIQTVRWIYALLAVAYFLCVIL